MKINHRIGLFLVFSAILLVALVLSVVGKAVMSKHIDSTRMNLAQQVSILSKSVEMHVRELSSNLIYFKNVEQRSLREKGIQFSGKALTKEFEQSDFIAIGEASRAKEKSISWMVSKQSNVSRASVEKSIASMELTELIRLHRSFVKPVTLENNEKFFIFIKPSSNSLVFAIINNTQFNSFSYPFRSGNDKFFLLGDEKSALAHPKFQYLGANLKDHLLSREIRATSKTMDVFVEEESGDTIIGGFDIVEGTNLHVGIIKPVMTFAQTMSNYWPNLLMALAVGFVSCFFLGLSLFKAVQRNEDYFKKSLVSLAAGQQLFPPDKEDGDNLEAIQALEDIQSQLLEITDSHRQLGDVEELGKVSKVSGVEAKTHIKAFASNIAQSIKTPVINILGHIHKLSSQPEVKSSGIIFRGLESEARRIKELVEDLRCLADEPEVLNQPVLLSDLVDNILREVLPTLNEKAIRLHKKLYCKHYVEANSVYLEKALHNLFDFFVASFRDQIQRDIIVRLEGDKADVSLSIEVNSEQLNREKFSDLLEPQGHSIFETGNLLALPVAKILIEGMGGQLQVGETGGNQGIKLLIEWPPMKKEEVEKYFSENKLPEDVLEEPSKDEVSEIVEHPIDEPIEEVAVIEHYNEQKEVSVPNTGVSITNFSKMSEESSLVSNSATEDESEIDKLPNVTDEHSDLEGIEIVEPSRATSSDENFEEISATSIETAESVEPMSGEGESEFKVSIRRPIVRGDS